MSAGEISILLVEDDVDIRDSIAELLREEGYLTDIAGNGTEALALLRSSRVGKFGLILLDRRMPEMDGVEFLRERDREAAHASIPVLLMTAHIVGEGLPAGATRMISKPFDIDSLLNTVREMLAEPQ